MLQREAPLPDRVCCLCGGDGAQQWHDCHAQPLFCTKCYRAEHALRPFHWISQWNGDFFERTTLTKLEVEIHTGHRGKPCPHHDWEWEDTDNEAAAEQDSGNFRIMVVDTSCVYNTMVRFCRCLDATTPDKQLFEIGLFPASFTRLKTAFTFALLDDFILDNLNVFLHLVLLKLLKWNGFCHKRRDLKDGELVLFCPTCPQPGINVVVPTEDNKVTSWLYTRSLVMDGNFKAKHLHPTNPEDECFMVTRARYQSHLAMAKDSVQRSECNNHRAVNQANASQHKLEATGIGGCACARHGCFVLNSMVDFQKGERCYNKHLLRRVDESLHLSIPSNMNIIPGIGLWHVHSHQDKCFVRYASNFIPGAAQIDGEIMETLWAPLNIISPSTRGMSTPHRQECLDYQMNNCNFMKMIRMDLDMIERWEAEEKEVQDSRMTDPTAMDVYEVHLHKAWSRKEVEIDLLQTAVTRTGEQRQLGAATWLASGITIEEMQIALAMEIRRMGRHPTETQTLEICWHQVRLQHSIDEFVSGATRYLGEEFDEDNGVSNMLIEFYEDGPEDNHTYDDARALNRHQPRDLFRPETAVIPLPSNLELDRCDDLGVMGFANDMLHGIWVHLADKAVLFRTTVRPARSQVTTTQVWVQVRSVEQVINLNSTIYKKCRAQMTNLGVDHLLDKYWELEKGDLKATSAVADPNARGQRNSTLPWFWLLDVRGDSVGNDWMNEFYRVHWLCTKALRDRWSEELLLVEHEMTWTINFLEHKAEMWHARMSQNGTPVDNGLRCYAIRQARMYRRLAEDACPRFVQVNPTFGHRNL
ncbi:hypothetical protein CY34DRAFT_21730 [Suillus luteus UH-Slu-Lm8-n1]|uniref:CxC2-like cysteine cluster KDZ transposase-associated domain-containing protein n=1 Tax=Suillus luteus UH-Slu-Lm8-n1 TaxID=930992 RepID=A0A0D0BAW7_9AGAM|nr:hypothetical protein CY34DRAFT_21730 [Suillus luteus UH-Slu-Lm8-n1]